MNYVGRRMERLAAKRMGYPAWAIHNGYTPAAYACMKALVRGAKSNEELAAEIGYSLKTVKCAVAALQKTERIRTKQVWELAS